ncbi:U8 snoRNA-decapping enzyme-like [Oscarella lobularis]|uniref:U8 snoRNA-decapping enzyme-like n=1 Tax=Oscarella lobularis TaxID=121494 RepID=UPI003313C144
METYRLVSREEALLLDSSYKHACHALLYAPCKDRLFGRIPIRYAIMMQMRFDGMIGFVGGFVDSGEDLTSGLRREVAEELGCAADEIEWSDDDHVTSHVDEINKFCLHFYAKRLTFEKFVAIERNSVNAVDHGLEVLGTIRCPVYTWKDTLGLPSFLRNNFVGMARDQLLDCLEREKILTKEQIDVALNATTSKK